MCPGRATLQLSVTNHHMSHCHDHHRDWTITLAVFGSPVSRGSCDCLGTLLTMAGDSQATFSKSVKAKIRETYDYRCVICLNFVQTSQCAHIIDAATAGKQQVCNEIVM